MWRANLLVQATQRLNGSDTDRVLAHYSIPNVLDEAGLRTLAAANLPIVVIQRLAEEEQRCNPAAHAHYVKDLF